MSNVDDIDLDVDLGDVEGGDGFLIEPGRYLLEIVDMSVKESKKGPCFLYTAEVIDTMDETKLRFAEKGRKVYEIINIDPESKQLWRLKELLGGAFGIEGGKKIPASIKGQPFSAMVFVDEYGNEERNKLKNHKKADGWDGIRFMMDGDELVAKDIDKGKPNGKSKSSSSKGRSSKRAASESSDEVEL